MASASRSRQGDLPVVLGPVLLAGLLCAWKLSTRSLWLDEGASLSIASQHGAALWRAIAHDGGNMLVFYLGLHVLIGLFGDGLVVLRITSVLSDALTAGLVAWLGLRLFGDRRIALAAGALSAVTVALVYWGQDARGYAAMVAAGTLSFVALVQLLEPSCDPAARAPLGALLLYALATALALYLGFDAVLLLPAQWLIALVLRRRLRVLLGAAVLVGLLCVPLVVLAIERGSSQLFWVPSLSLTVLWQTLDSLVGSGMAPNFHTTVVSVICAVVVSGLGLVAVIAALAQIRTLWRVRDSSSATARDAGDPGAPTGSDRRAGLTVTVLWLLVPLALGVLASAVGEPIELARIAILMVPALSLLLAWLCLGVPDGLSDRARRDRFPALRAPALAGTAALLVVLGLRVAVLVPTYTQTPEPWKQVAQHVLATTTPGDCVAFYPQDGRMPFGYYVSAAQAARVPRPLLPAESWSARTPHVEQYIVPSPARLRALTRDCASVLLIAAHQGQLHGATAISHQHAVGYTTLRAELAKLYPSDSQTGFGYAARILVTTFRR